MAIDNQISLIRITKIFSKNGKLISQAGPQKQITKEMVKADQGKKRADGLRQKKLK